MTSRLQGSGDSSLKPGASLMNRYSIIRVLGVGGMGSVYQARDLRFPNVTKYAAVKEIINIADSSMREMVVKIFEREANTLASLDHPAIPKIYDYFNQGDRSFLVMEFIDGRDLETYLNDNPGMLAEEAVVEWSIDLCDVLSYLHNHKDKDGKVEPIIFRDLKPSNIMLDQHQTIRLIDFGIARNYMAGQKGTMIGTEGYSPPEQYRGESSPAGDIYALGATLHHLLTKQDPRIEPPFSFNERPIRKANPNVSMELEAIINTALNYNPQDRFPTAHDMKVALQTFKRKTSALSISKPLPTGRIDPAKLPGAQPTAEAPEAASAPAVVAGGTVSPLWAFKCEDEVRGSPAVANNVVYVGAYDNNLYAVSAPDGKMLWKYATDGGLPGSPSVYQDIVYIGSEDRRLHAVSTRSGKVQWSYYADGPIRSSPRIADGHVFIGADDAKLHAVSIANTRATWKFAAADAVRCRPAIGGGMVYFGSENGDFYAVDMKGERKWAFKAKRALTSSPVVFNNTIYVGSVDGNVYALDANNGWKIWQFRASKPIISSPAVEGNLLVIGAADGFIYAIDIRSGREAWRYQTEGQVNSSPVIHKGGTYVGSVDGCVYALELSNGKLRWKFKSGGPIISSPAVANETIVVGSFDKHLYALAA